MIQRKRIGKIMKVKTLALLDAIVAAILIEGSRHLLPFSALDSKVLVSTWLILGLSLLLILSLSFLTLFFLKFRIANKALLEENPHFYEEREFDKWFNYYAKQTEEKNAP
jgi:hypothetical protein